MVFAWLVDVVVVALFAAVAEVLVCPGDVPWSDAAVAAVAPSRLTTRLTTRPTAATGATILPSNERPAAAGCRGILVDGPPTLSS